MALRWAMSVAPHAGGIHSFYGRLHDVLTDAGQTCVSFEMEDEATRWESYDATLARPGHQRIPGTAPTVSAQDAARAVADWLETSGTDVLIVTPMSPWPVLDALPHLPARTRVLLRFAEISHHNYRHPLRATGYDGLITLCPRQEDDLDRLGLGVGLPRYRLPNGVDTERFRPGPAREAGSPLRLLVLDRMVHLQKRILLLPKVLRTLEARSPDLDWCMSVMGDGPDAAALDQALAPWIVKGRVLRSGRVAAADVPHEMAAHDIYLKLSTNEGSPNAVLEAMACGCVPVAAAIPGVTDFVIADGHTGRIVAPDAPEAMAQAIVDLAGDAEGLARMGASARMQTSEAFSLRCFARHIAEIQVSLPVSERIPRLWSAFATIAPTAPGVLHRGARRLFPLALRTRLRERLRGG